MSNIYRIRVEKCTNNIINQRVHFVEAECYKDAEKMLYKIYDLMDDTDIVDIVSTERIANDVIHYREHKN